MSRILLIDADLVAYQICCNNEKEYVGNDIKQLCLDWNDVEFRPDVSVLGSLHTECYQSTFRYIKYLKDKLSADRVICALSDSENFRKEVLPSYKEHRKSMRKPLALSFVRDNIRQEFECKELPTLEADDTLGILSTMPSLKGQKIIVSIDKDFFSIPGYFVNPKDIRKVDKANVDSHIHNVSEDQANYNFFMQTLTGDVADNYKGFPGIGPAKAKKLLDNYLDKDSKFDMIGAWSEITELSEKDNIDMLTQARCARILRFEDYDIKNKRVKLWKL